MTQKPHCGKNLRILLEDMSRFALRNCYIVDKVPMQIYMSSLLFAPANSNTRQIFGHNLQRYFGLMPRIPDNWGTERQKPEGHYGNVTTAAFSPAGRIIVSGSTDNTIRLRDTVTGKERQKLDGHDDAVAFSSDGTSIVSGSRDLTIRLWDTATGHVKRMLEGHTKSVNAVAFSPDDEILVSGSADTTLRLWDTATGKERQKLEGHDDRVLTVAFSPDGHTIVSGSADRTVRFWDVAQRAQWPCFCCKIFAFGRRSSYRIRR